MIGAGDRLRDSGKHGILLTTLEDQPLAVAGTPKPNHRASVGEPLPKQGELDPIRSPVAQFVLPPCQALADSRNNTPENGLALSRNAHWLFDKGLWTVETPRKDEFIIRVANEQFEEASPFGPSLRLFDGRPLFFAPGTKLRPDADYFTWHREKRFGKASD